MQLVYILPAIILWGVAISSLFVLIYDIAWASWGDVNFISCTDLRSIPDGVPIPADAGSSVFP